MKEQVCLYIHIPGQNPEHGDETFRTMNTPQCLHLGREPRNGTHVLGAEGGAKLSVDGWGWAMVLVLEHCQRRGQL